MWWTLSLVSIIVIQRGFKDECEWWSCFEVWGLCVCQCVSVWHCPFILPFTADLWACDNCFFPLHMEMFRNIQHLSAAHVTFYAGWCQMWVFCQWKKRKIVKSLTSLTHKEATNIKLRQKEKHILLEGEVQVNLSESGKSPDLWQHLETNMTVPATNCWWYHLHISGSVYSYMRAFINTNLQYWSICNRYPGGKRLRFNRQREQIRQDMIDCLVFHHRCTHLNP